MGLLAGLLIWLTLVAISMIVAGYLSKRWGHDPFGWLLLCAALGPIAIVALVGRRQAESERTERFQHVDPRPTDRKAQKVVLAACDGSPVSEEIARYIVDEYEDADEVVLLTVLPIEARPPDGALTEDVQRRVAHCGDVTAKILRDGGLNARVVLGYGNAGEEILHYCDQEKAGVVVVGRRGAGLSRALLGSVSDHVVKNATAPVVVIGR